MKKTTIKFTMLIFLLCVLFPHFSYAKVDIWEVKAAIDDNNVKRVRDLIDIGADINGTFTEASYVQGLGSFTLFTYSASIGRTEIVRFLLDKGVDINSTSDSRSTALLYAAWFGHTKTAKLLIDRGADVNIKNEFGLTPLIIAAAYGHLDIIKLLIQAGADVYAAEPDGKTALGYAQERGYVEIYKFLKQAGKKAEEKLNKARELSEKGYQHYLKKEYDKAIELNTSTIKAYPTFIDAYFRRGNVYLDTKQYEKAIKDYSEVIKLPSDSATTAIAYISRGMVYEAMEKYDEAIADYNTGIDKDPKNDDAYMFRRMAYIMKGEFDKAAEDLIKACDLGNKGACEILQDMKDKDKKDKKADGD